MKDYSRQKTNYMNLKTLQVENKAWAEYNFPGYEDYYPLLGIFEECGELAHAMLKIKQGIRGTKEDHEAKAKDAIGDIVIFLACYCNAMGFDLQECVEQAWAQVKKRDWRKNPVDGGV